MGRWREFWRGLKGKQLPAIDKGYRYDEYTLDGNNSNPGNRGKYRAVVRVNMNDGRKSPTYVTLDHYKTFCEVQ